MAASRLVLGLVLGLGGATHALASSDGFCPVGMDPSGSKRDNGAAFDGGRDATGGPASGHFDGSDDAGTARFDGCSFCHDDGVAPFAADLVLDIFDLNTSTPATEPLTPGETYRLRMTVDFNLPSKGVVQPDLFGFQLVAFEGTGTTKAGSLVTPVDEIFSRISLGDQTRAGNEYWEHLDPYGTFGKGGDSPDQFFEAEWTAPSTVTEVTFYYSGLVVDFPPGRKASAGGKGGAVEDTDKGSTTIMVGSSPPVPVELQEFDVD